MNRTLSTSGHSENYSQDDFFIIFNSFLNISAIYIEWKRLLAARVFFTSIY